ncbi:MAG TPA: PfkB family carbohydrate kinase [Pseudorhodoplanes sp.]|nr:PfkB family carbohydrate kinase [Pseudorhodoplanes sp.]
MSSPDASPLILCAGIAVVDYIFKVGAMPKPDTKNRASAFMVASGGNMANAAVSIVRLGARAKLSAPFGGPAGIDLAGDAALRKLEQEKIDCSGIVRVDGLQSPISAILVQSGGERAIVNYRDDALAQTRYENPERLVETADAVLIDNRFPEFSLPIAQAARKSGKIVVMDADDPTRETDALLNACTHVVFSSHGLRNTAQMQDFTAGLNVVAERTPALLAVTDGANGSWWHDGKTVRHFAAHPVRAIDTLGAGDVFHGACVLMLAEGRDFEQALRFSAAAAAIKCTRFGGVAGAPDRQEVEAFLAPRTRS